SSQLGDANDRELGELRQLLERPEIASPRETHEHVGQLLEREQHREIFERNSAQADEPESRAAADDVEILRMTLQEERAQAGEHLQEAQGESLAGLAECEGLEVGAEIGEARDIVDIPDREMKTAEALEVLEEFEILHA